MWIKSTPSWLERHTFDGDLDVSVQAEDYGNVRMFRARVFGDEGHHSHASFEEAKLNALRRAVNFFGPKIDALRDELKCAEQKRVCNSCNQEIQG
jgi:hypothetical protein